MGKHKMIQHLEFLINKVEPVLGFFGKCLAVVVVIFCVLVLLPIAFVMWVIGYAFGQFR